MSRVVIPCTHRDDAPHFDLIQALLVLGMAPIAQIQQVQHLRWIPLDAVGFDRGRAQERVLLLKGFIPVACMHLMHGWQGRLPVL